MIRTALALFALSLPAAALEPLPYRVEVLAQGLDRPWSVELLPDTGDALIAQRGGTFALWRVADGQRIDLAGGVAVDDQGQGGLLDIALAPDFATTGAVYAVWSAPARGGATAVLGRFTLDAQAGRMRGPEVLFTAAPAMNSPAHFGARIVVADGHLFLGLGDRAQKDFGPGHVAQDPGRDWGSVLRLTLDGTPAPGNPDWGRGARPGVWSIGHRNIQAMAQNPATGAIWVGEHGENGGDEINILSPGANFGWPLAAQGLTYRGAEVFAPPHTPGDGFTGTVWHSPPGRADPFPPSGMAFYTGAAFDGWQGALLLGNLGQRYLGVFPVQDVALGTPLRLLADRDWRIRDVAVGADGLIYGLSDGEGAVLFRVSPGAP